MQQELRVAGEFLTRFLARQADIDESARKRFFQAVCRHIAERMQTCWYPETPLRGSARRSVTIFHGRLDAVLINAATDARIPKVQLLNAFPPSLVVWIDPQDVSYRLGSDQAPISVLYQAEKQPPVEAQAFTTLPLPQNNPANKFYVPPGLRLDQRTPPKTRPHQAARSLKTFEPIRS
jgi:protein Tob/BTG